MRLILRVEFLDSQERNKVVSTLIKIHNKGILHGDIHPDNILLQGKGNGLKVMFIDFGFSKTIVNKWEATEEIAALKCMLCM